MTNQKRRKTVLSRLFIILLPIVVFILVVQKNLAQGMTLGMMRDLK